MGDIKLETISVLDCENYSPDKGAKPADQCYVQTCFSVLQDPELPARCVNFMAQGKSFVTTHKSNATILNELKRRDSSFRIKPEHLVEAILLDQVFSRTGLKREPLLEATVVVHARLLSLPLKADEPVSQNQQKEFIQELGAFQIQHPAFHSVWEKANQAIQSSSHFSRAIKERSLWISTVLESYEKLLAPMKEVLEVYYNLKPPLQTLAGQWIQFLLVGGNSRDLESPELTAAIKEFYQTQALPLPDPGAATDAFFTPLSTGFYELADSIPVAADRASPVETRYRVLENFLTRSYQRQLSRLVLLEEISSEQVFQESLIIVYGTNPIREQLVKLLLAHAKVEGFSKPVPDYHLDMDSLAEDLHKLAAGSQATEVKAELAGFLVRFFDPQAKLEVFWQGRYREVPGFHSVLEFGPNRTHWAELIYWIRSEVSSGDLPHYPVRKLGLFSDIGVGLLGGALLASGYWSDSSGLQLSGGGLLGAGIGGVAGNLACYALDLPNDYFLCDLLGAGALGAGGLWLGSQFTSERKSGPAPANNGQNNPVNNDGNNPTNNDLNNLNNDHNNRNNNNTPNNENNDPDPTLRQPTDEYGP